MKSLKNIQKEVSDLQYLITTFEKTNSVPEIELDICLDKIKSIYQELKNININEQIEKNEDFIDSFDVEDSLTPNIEEDSYIETTKEATTPDQENEAEQILTEGEVEEEVVIPEKEIIIKDSDNNQDKETTETSVSESHKVIEQKPQKESIKSQKKSESKNKGKTIIADQISNNKRSLNDLISQNNQNNDLSSQFKKKKIIDLNRAISLNDKIWFTKKLFNGDNSKFNSTLNSINSAQNLDEAINIITESNTWDSESPIVQKFLSIVSRRFQ